MKMLTLVVNEDNLALFAKLFPSSVENRTLVPLTHDHVAAGFHDVFMGRHGRPLNPQRTLDMLVKIDPFVHRESRKLVEITRARMSRACGGADLSGIESEVQEVVAARESAPVPDRYRSILEMPVLSRDSELRRFDARELERILYSDADAPSWSARLRDPREGEQ